MDRFTRESAAYVAGYVTRKVLGRSIGTKLAPFIRMSNGSRGQGGIGASAMHDVASTVLQYNLALPSALGGQRPQYLGRYLRRKLSEFTGQEITRQQNELVQHVCAVAWENGISPQKVFAQINEIYDSQLQQREALREKVL